ncbi:MAG: acyl-CoA thioesterase [Acidiferrobacteraceae bacterium]|nr:acyl-CoA thioesterase [Acidiferrobacteraceae bacterium]|tara:strand:+ start:67977 stop:68372 length:396 start_codon:yes stop_codon:yes gene_type:complete
MIRDAAVNSTPSLRTVAMPADANANGDIFGGWLMSQMDLAGGVHAHQVAKGRTVTVAVDGMSFHLPVQIGDLVTCYCETVRIGRTSITIKVDTWVKRRSSGHEEKVTEGLFTFVAIDAEGNPRIIKGSSSG